MNRQEIADKWYDTIMELYGADEFKDKVKQLRVFQNSRMKYSVTDVRIPNYLWIAKRGGGVSTCIKAFAEFMDAEKIIEFNGIVKYFEFNLAYIPPEGFFSELTRLNNTISEIAGHHRYFKGLACIHIEEWLDHANEDNFHKALDFLAAKHDKLRVVFVVDTDDKRVIESIESSISSRLRLETIAFRFPETNELVDYIERGYFTQQGFSLEEDARNLLSESINAMAAGKHFNGFVTVNQLARDILYQLLISDTGNQSISADMLVDFNKDSTYINRLKSFVETRNIIGFGATEEFSR